MRASELLLIVRAQNQASGALRRVAGDLKGLSALSGLKQRGQSLQIARNQLNMQRQIAASELQSITSGKRALGLQRDRMAASIAMQNAVLREGRVKDAMAGREAQALRNQARISSLKRAMDSPLAVGTRFKELQMKLRAAEIDSTRLAQKQAYLADRMGVATAATQKQSVAMQVLAAREAEAARRADVLRNRISNYGDRLRLNTDQINANNRAISNARWDRVAAGGRILQHSARIMEYAGLVLGGSLAVMAHQSAQFSTSVTLAATQTRKIGQSFKATAVNSQYLQKQILGLMKQFPATAQEMSNAAYDIYSSLNVSLPGGTKLLKLFNQAAVAGQTGLEEVTAAGITVMNNFRLKVPQVSDAFQTMFAAVRFGRMTFKEFVAMMPQLSPAFAAAGFGLKEMAQAAAFMTRVMPNTRMAATSLARLTEMFGRKDFIAGAQKMGVRITDIHKRLLPLPDIVDRLAKKFPTIGKAIKAGRGDTELQNIFKTITALGSGKEGTMGTIQGRRALIFLVTQSKLAHQVYRQVAGDQKEFTNSLKAMEKTTGVRWGVFVNQLKALALEIGSHVVPALLAMAGPIEAVVKWWEKLDDGTKRTVARLATFTAAGLLVGGALAFILGSITRLFATFGRFLGLSTGLAATFTLLALSAAVLTGNIKQLSDILTVISNFAFGSFEGFAITMGIAAVSAVKLTAALRGMAAVEGTIAGGGILAGLLGRGKGAKAGFNLARMGGGGLKQMLMGAAAGAGLLSTSLLPVVGIVGAVGAGLLLWKLHMDGVRRQAEAVKRATALGAAPRQQFDVFQQLPGTVGDITRTTIGIRQLQRGLADLRKAAAGAKGRQRLELLDQIQLQTLDIADAQGKLSDLNAKANRQFDAYTAGLARFVPAAREVERLQNKLVSVQQKLADRGVPPKMAERVLKPIREQLNAVTSGMRSTAMNLESMFKGVVNQFSKMRLLPKVSGPAMSDMFNVSKRLGRALTIPEMKAVIRAEVDPASRRRLPAVIRAIFGQIRAQRIKVMVETATAKKAATSFARQIGTTPAKLKAIFTMGSSAKQEHDKAAKVLKPIHQKIIVDQQNWAAIGASIASGIQAGVNANPINVDIIKNIITHSFEIKSPSRWAAREVGKPIMQGIIVGLLSQLGQLEKTATIVADIFGGTVLSKFDETKKKKITAAVLTKDLQSQVGEYKKFNQALSRLTRRGAPKELIDQLAALGPEAAGKIALLSNMTAKELKRYVALWRKAQAEVKKSMRATQEDIKNGLKAAVQQGVDNLMGMFDNIKSTNVQNFGGLFDGLDNMVGDNFKSAMDEYNNSMADFRSQIKDLNQQLVDTQQEAQQRLIDAIAQRKDELQQIMGQLFSGDWLSGTIVTTRMEWGQKLGFDDLQKDLESQVTKFQRWRDDLVSLASKVPPDLAKQLEALGPEAVDKLDILNSGTDAQLAAYVATWQQGQAAIAAVANQTTVDTSDITARVNDILTQIDEVTKKMGQLQMPHELTGQDIIDNLKKQQAQWIEYEGIIQGLIDRGLPMELIQQLREMGPQALPYLKALIGMSDEQLGELTKTYQKNQDLINASTLKTLNEQLFLWYQYGKGIANNIIAGIDSEHEKLAKYFKELIMSLLKGIAPPAPPPITPPGANDKPPYPIGGTPPGPTQSSDPGKIGDTYNYYVNQDITAVQDESLMSTLESAAFRIRTMRPT